MNLTPAQMRFGHLQRFVSYSWSSLWKLFTSLSSGDARETLALSIVVSAIETAFE